MLLWMVVAVLPDGAGSHRPTRTSRRPPRRRAVKPGPSWLRSVGGFRQVIAGAASDGRQVTGRRHRRRRRHPEGIWIYTPATDTWGFQHFSSNFQRSPATASPASAARCTSPAATSTRTTGSRLLAPAARLRPGRQHAHQEGRHAAGLAEGVVGVITASCTCCGASDADYWPQPGRQRPPTDGSTVTTRRPIAGRRRRRRTSTGTARRVIGGKLYVVEGRRPTGPEASLDVYDPVADSWKTLAPIPTPGGAIGTALAGKLYVVAGTQAYVYDPGTNSGTRSWRPQVRRTRRWRGSYSAVGPGSSPSVEASLQRRRHQASCTHLSAADLQPPQVAVAGADRGEGIRWPIVLDVEVPESRLLSPRQQGGEVQAPGSHVRHGAAAVLWPVQ